MTSSMMPKRVGWYFHRVPAPFPQLKFRLSMPIVGLDNFQRLFPYRNSQSSNGFLLLDQATQKFKIFTDVLLTIVPGTAGLYLGHFRVAQCHAHHCGPSKSAMLFHLKSCIQITPSFMKQDRFTLLHLQLVSKSQFCPKNP
jgi:hypothetical protein